MCALLAAASLPAPTAAVVLRGRLQSSAGEATAGLYANTTAATATSQRRAPRIYFLFMAVDKVSNLDIWKAFFAEAPSDQFQAYVHCKLYSCIEATANSPLQPVPVTAHSYCTDLVSPMIQLINAALGDVYGSPNELDKFTFLSDSTLPLKPFPIVYNTLSQRAGSDFCVFPAAEWADVMIWDGSLDLAPKYHQWISLVRHHALDADQKWSSYHSHNFMAEFGLNTQGYNQQVNNTFGDSRNFGCLDEFWFMAALFGKLHRSDHGEQSVNFQSFTGSPVQISGYAGWQGQCDTFVLWPHQNNGPFRALYAALDGPSVPHSGDRSRPGWWDKLSTNGMSTLRNSSFLFARKFIDSPALADPDAKKKDFLSAYKSIVLES